MGELLMESWLLLTDEDTGKRNHHWPCAVTHIFITALLLQGVIIHPHLRSFLKEPPGYYLSAIQLTMAARQKSSTKYCSCLVMAAWTK